MLLLTALLTLPLLSPSVPVGGLDCAQVDEQSKWIVHSYTEAFRATQLHQELKAMDKEGELERDLSEVASEFGIQLLEDVHSITAYGTVLGEEHGVVLVRGNANIESALAKAQTKGHGKPIRLGERDCMQWGEGDEPAVSCLLPATGERRELVLARTQTELAQALAVLDKQRPALESTPQSELYAAPSAGTIAFVAASGILEELAGAHGHDVQQLSVMTRLAKGLRLELGETSGNLFLDLRLRTERPEDAQRIQKIFDGLLALPGLLHGDSETGEVFDRLSQAIRVESLNEVAHLRFQFGTQALFQEIRRLQESLDEDASEHLRALHPRPGKKPAENPK